jgi:hypothetical protein
MLLLETMLKSKGLDLYFMALTFLILNFFFVFLELIIHLRSSSNNSTNNFVEFHQFNVVF